MTRKPKQFIKYQKNNNQMIYSNYKEGEHNNTTKRIQKLLQQDSYSEIIEMYQRISEKERTGEQTRCAVASLIFLKQINEARSLLDIWQNIGKDDVQWNIQYGWTYYLEQNYEKAILYFNKVEDLNPMETTILNYLQECNEKTGNKEEVARIKNRIKELHTSKNTGDKYSRENYYKQ